MEGLEDFWVYSGCMGTFRRVVRNAGGRYLPATPEETVQEPERWINDASADT
jgi:hypothetical protein